MRFYNLQKNKIVLANPLIKRFLNQKLVDNPLMKAKTDAKGLYSELVIEDALRVYMRYLK